MDNTKKHIIFQSGKAISCYILSIATRFMNKKQIEILLKNFKPNQQFGLLDLKEQNIYQSLYIRSCVEMSQSNTVSPKKYQPASKTVFLTERKGTKFMCGMCPMFDQDQTEFFDKQTKLTRKNEAKHVQKQNNNPKKQNKKSLKSNVRIRESYVNKADSSQLKPIEQNYHQHKIQTSTKMNSQSRIKTFDAKKTEFSDRDLIVYQRQIMPFHQTLNVTQVAHYSSCTNLNVDLIKNSLENSPKTRIERFSHVPIVQSNNSEDYLAAKDFYKIHPTRQLVRVASEHHNLQLIKFKSSLTHKSSNITISPVMPVANPEEKEISHFIYCNRNDSNQNTINRLVELASSPVLKEKKYECQSGKTVKTSFKPKENQFTQQHISEPVIPEQHNLTPNHYYEQDHSFNSKQSNQFLQISINQNEPLKSSRKTVSKMQISLPQSMERLKLQQSSDRQSAIQIRVSTQKMYSSQTEYDINQPQQIETEQETPVTVSKKSKIGKNILSRYSVQVPTSKKFSKFKVRRTISMKDQQDSSEEETSQVIYGFRKTHNLEVVEDIAEDMHDSFMTRGDIRIDPSEMHDLHNF